MTSNCCFELVGTIAQKKRVKEIVLWTLPYCDLKYKN